MSQPGDQIQTLTASITDEIFKALGVSPSGGLRTFLGPLFKRPAERFAQLAAAFDQQVARSGIIEAARWMLPRFTEKIMTHGAEHIPSHGPLLITTNHPGTYDVLVIAANLPRKDLKIVAAGIPFVQSLPHARDHLIFATTDTHQRMSVARSAIRHLNDGGALLICPSGTIDPDPAIMPGAHQAIETWSPSVELFLRRVPQTTLLLTIVSHVLLADYLRNPLTRLRKLTRDRQRIAEFIQVIQQMVLDQRLKLTPTVSFGKPLTYPELRAGIDSSITVLQGIIHKAQQLLTDHLSSFSPPASSLVPKSSSSQS